MIPESLLISNEGSAMILLIMILLILIMPMVVGYWYGRNQLAPYVDPDEYEWKD